MDTDYPINRFDRFIRLTSLWTSLMGLLAHVNFNLVRKHHVVDFLPLQRNYSSLQFIIVVNHNSTYIFTTFSINQFNAMNPQHTHDTQHVNPTDQKTPPTKELSSLMLWRHACMIGGFQPLVIKPPWSITWASMCVLILLHQTDMVKAQSTHRAVVLLVHKALLLMLLNCTGTQSSTTQQYANLPVNPLQQLTTYLQQATRCVRWSVIGGIWPTTHPTTATTSHC